MDADALEKEAEDLAAKVEEKHDFSCIAKSNTLYNTALLLLVSIIGSPQSLHWSTVTVSVISLDLSGARQNAIDTA